MSDFDPIIKKISDYVQNYQANEESLQEAKTCFFDSIACAFMALEHDQVKNPLKNLARMKITTCG